MERNALFNTYNADTGHVSMLILKRGWIMPKCSEEDMEAKCIGNQHMKNHAYKEAFQFIITDLAAKGDVRAINNLE